MKTNILTLALAFFTLAAVAQKKEVRNAGNAVDDENFEEAKSLLEQAEPNLSELNDKWTERFYLYKGNAYLGSTENVSVEDMLTASEAFNKAIEMGSDEAQQGLTKISSALVESAVADQNSEKFEQAAEKLYTSYKVNNKDTIYLYYAAANSLNAQDYDKALEYYEMLREVGFDGSGVEYLATNTETGEQENLGSKEQQDLMVKTDQYSDPVEEKVPSKRGEIAKNMALIYINQEENEKAIELMDEAKEQNPDDVMLLQAEADMYYRMDDKQKYNEIMQEVLEKSPDDPAIYYNLGVTTADLGDSEGAIEYYEKALELDPEMNEARMNIVVAILAKERELIDQMNELGMSADDQKKYEELEKERMDIYEEVTPYLEEVIEHDPTNVEAIRTAMNIYSATGKEEKAAEMKAKLEQ